MEPTSEQELKQLLEEGRITEEEHRELLEAIRQKETAQKPVEKAPESKPRTGYGKVALILFILSIALPVVSILLSFILNTMKIKIVLATPLVLIGLLCALLAFIFGIIGWRTTQGKIVAIGIPVLGIFTFLLIPLASILLAIAIPVLRGKRVQPEYKHELLKSYSLDSTEGVLSPAGVEEDRNFFAEGVGSLKIVNDSLDKKSIHFFETGPMSIQNQILIYSAKLRSEGLDGRAYLEMWCEIPAKGEFFSRSIEAPIMGTTEWTTVQTPFRFEHGQSPANVKLNLVIEGLGAVWVDDIKLSSSALH